VSTRTTPSQTVGPFFHIGLTGLLNGELAGPEVEGERIEIRGQVLDADRKAVNDALLEIWQANRHGKYAHPEDRQAKPLQPGFTGFGRVATDGNGIFRIATIKPGPVPGPNDTLQAPHLAVAVFMRGLLKHLVTRVYFSDESANADDPILRLVPAQRRATLIARRVAGEKPHFEWNVILRGRDETVFFDY
jgi:protocatechuate 3,4-dioxygenase, alpha subunit